MVAASPERHDGGLQANPVEVQSYQPPWKVLSDFALQSDIDQPAFQQLVSVSSLQLPCNEWPSVLKRAHPGTWLASCIFAALLPLLPSFLPSPLTARS